MVYKKILYFSAFLGAFIALNSFSMETPLLSEIQVADYDQERDIKDIDAIFRSDWARLEASRPYDENLVLALFEPWPHTGGAMTKFRKVLRHHDKTIGFITYYYNANINRGYCEVAGIAPDYRRKGLAKYYLDEVIKALKQAGANHVELFCKKDNQISKSLYDKFGFEIVSDTQFKGIAYLLRKNI